jgi:hypothetical protein
MANVEDFVVAANGNIDEPYITSANFAEFFSSTIARLDDVLPAWWSRARDVRMSRLWREITPLSILMFPAQTKIASMPMRVVAVDPNIESHNRMADELTRQFIALSQFGEGFAAAMESFAQDYFGTDNGGHLEVVADGPKSEPIVGRPLGVRHLDSLRVDRMSDPIHPIRVIRSGQEPESYHYTRVISFAQMRSAREEMNGVGFCAVSRTIALAQKYQDYINYVRGKMGGRPFKRLLVAKNMSGRELMKAIAASVAIQQEIGGLETESIALGGPELEVSAVDLTNFEQLSEEEATFNTMALMALAWGLEFNEAFPMAGSKASEEVALQRSRGRLPALFISKFEKLASLKLVPSFLRVELDYVDDYLDQQRAIIADIRERSLQRAVEAGILTPQAARDRLYQDRYISETALLTMALQDGVLPDGTPAMRAFFDANYDDILMIDRMLLMGDGEPEEARRAIQMNTLYIYNLFPQTTSPAKHNRYRIALRALQDLQTIYDRPATVTTPPQETSSQQPASEPTEPEDSEPVQQEGEGEDTNQDAEREEVKSRRFRKDVALAERHRRDVREKVLALLMLRGAMRDEDLMTTVESAMVTAALLALGAERLADEYRSPIDVEMLLLDSSLATIRARSLRGKSMEPTADRIANRVMSIYWGTLVHAGVMDEATWTLGATQEHCEHCAYYAGLGAQPASFWKQVAEREGHWPGSPALACSGVNCDCQFT